MKGLLLKDFYTIKSSIISLLITFMVIGFGISFFVVPQVLIIIATIVLGMSVTTIFNIDKKSGWLKTSITFPTKKMIIPGLFEPPVRILRATIPENESHIFR